MSTREADAEVQQDQPDSSDRWFTFPIQLVAALLLICLGLWLVRSPVGEWVASAVRPASQTIEARAAFRVADDCGAGVQERWGSKHVVADEPGTVRVEGLALHHATTELTSYRMDADVQLGAGGIGWVVRAADTENYYAFELTGPSKRSNKQYRLVRYAVIGGEPQKAEQVEVEVPAEVFEEGFNRLSVRVRGNHITTLINGQGVDYWQDSRLAQGGVGFFSLGKRSGLIRHVSLRGNEDSLGLFLYGFVQTVQGMNQLLSLPGDVS